MRYRLVFIYNWISIKKTLSRRRGKKPSWRSFISLHQDLQVIYSQAEIHTPEITINRFASSVKSGNECMFIEKKNVIGTRGIHGNFVKKDEWTFIAYLIDD